MAAAIVVSVLLQQFKALPGGLVGPWVLGRSSLLFFFALVSQLQTTKNAFYWQHSSNVCGFVQQVIWGRVPKFAEHVFLQEKAAGACCAGSECCQGDCVPLCLVLWS